MATAKNLADSERAAVGFALLDATAPEPIGFWDWLLDTLPNEAFKDSDCRKAVKGARDLQGRLGRGASLDPAAIASVADLKASDLYLLFETDHGTRTTNERAATESVDRIADKHYTAAIAAHAPDPERVRELLAMRDNIRGHQLGYDLEPLSELMGKLSDKPPEGLQTGIGNLDAQASIPPHGVTVVAAKSGHGKTTMLLNLAFNMASHYTDKHFFFFSYEQPREDLARRIITIWNNTKNPAKLEEIGKRLWLIDNSYPVNDLIAAISHLHQKHGDKTGAFFVDYIQEIPSGGAFKMRQLELAYISRALRETTTRHKIPIIVGAQARRDMSGKRVTLDDIREAGDIGNIAWLVLGLWNHTAHEAQTENTEGGPTMDLDVFVLKNRDGRAGTTAKLEFNGPKQRITDPEGGGQSENLNDGNWESL